MKPEIGSKWVAQDIPFGDGAAAGEVVVVLSILNYEVHYATEDGRLWVSSIYWWNDHFRKLDDPEDKDYVFKVGDKVVCRHPKVVCENFKDVVGEIIEHMVPTFDGEQVFSISYEGGDHQVAFSKTDGVKLVEEAGVSNEKTPTELTAGGKIASDGGPSEYYDFPEGCSTLNDLIEYKGMSFAQGNIFKAAYRLGNKEGISLEYDLKKIVYYAERMLAQIEGDK